MQHGAPHAAEERCSSMGRRQERMLSHRPCRPQREYPSVRTVLGWQRTHVGAFEVMRPRCVRHTTGRLSLVHACPGRVDIAVLAHKEDNR
jgi:hypothetical protein